MSKKIIVKFCHFVKVDAVAFVFGLFLRKLSRELLILLNVSQTSESDRECRAGPSKSHDRGSLAVIMTFRSVVPDRFRESSPERRAYNTHLHFKPVYGIFFPHVYF